MSKSLSPRERSFALNYIVSRDAKAAALKAGVSAVSAKQIGHRMMGRPRVREEIARLERLSARQVQRFLPQHLAGEQPAT